MVDTVFTDFWYNFNKKDVLNYAKAVSTKKLKLKRWWNKICGQLLGRKLAFW